MPELMSEVMSFLHEIMNISIEGLDLSQFYDSFGSFKPVPDYQQPNRRRLEYNRGLQINAPLFQTMIICDYFLRQATQQEEAIKDNLMRLQNSSEDKDKIRREHKDLEYTKSGLIILSEMIHLLEIQLPEKPLKRT